VPIALARRLARLETLQNGPEQVGTLGSAHLFLGDVIESTK